MKRTLRLLVLAGGIVATVSLVFLLPTPGSTAYAQRARYGYGMGPDGAYVQHYGGYGRGYYSGYGRGYYGGYGRGYLVSPYDPGLNRYSGFGNGPYVYGRADGYAYPPDAVYGNPASYGRSYGRADAAYGYRVYYSPYGYGPY